MTQILKKVFFKPLVITFLLIAAAIIAKAQMIDFPHEKYFAPDVQKKLIEQRQAKFDSLVNTADVIFEGKHLYHDSYLVDTTIKRSEVNYDTEVTVCFVYDVEKIYKGHDKINYGKIQLINSSKLFGSSDGNCIVFCKLNKNPNFKPCFDNKYLNNTTTLSAYFSFWPTSSEKDNMTGGDFYFKNSHKCRNYLKKYPDIKIKEDPEEQLLYRIAKVLHNYLNS